MIIIIIIFIFAQGAKLCFSAANGFIGNHAAFAVATKDEILPAWWLEWWIVGISDISGTDKQATCGDMSKVNTLANILCQY